MPPCFPSSVVGEVGGAGPGAWRHVRHVPAGPTWHPATDQLRGTDQYGDSGVSGQAWSLAWADQDFDQLLLGTANLQNFVIVERAELTGLDGNKAHSSIIRLLF